MRILITNDDGIQAPGLDVLHAIASEVAGPDGEVWTVAPAFEQSGVAHMTNHKYPNMLAEIGPHRYAAEGSPADCVLAGLHDVMKDARPDLVLSGVNRGNNAAENVHYSGTIGAALEAALQGLPAIALSQFFGPDNASLDDPFEAARAYGAETVRRILDAGLWGDGPYRLLHNVNFPPCPAADVKGTRAAPMGWRDETYFTVEPQTRPGGRRFVWLKGGPQHHAAEPGSDVTLNLDGFITVTPVRTDVTAHETLDALQAALR